MPNLLAIGRWSRKHDACAQCGRADSPHCARGTCRRCYEASPARMQAHREHARAYQRAKRRPQASTAGPRWSKLYDRCTKCGTAQRPHAARGLCHPCYDATPARLAKRTAKEARRAAGVDDAVRARRNAQARSRYAAKTTVPFPAIGAPVLIVLTGEVGRIVGYSKAYDEWLVRVPGEPDLHWEPCDLALAPDAETLRRAA